MSKKSPYQAFALWQVWVSDPEQSVFNPAKASAFTSREEAVAEVRRREAESDLLYYLERRMLHVETIDPIREEKGLP